MARILVVDDQPQILKMIESLLVDRGHVVVTAKDGHDAVDKIKSQPFEMVITDAIMPGGVSGFDVVKTIRNSGKSEMLTMLLTGKREKRDVERGIAAGVDDYCVKPVDPDLFLAKIEALLKKKEMDHKFTECSVAEPAKYLNAIKVVGVSEIGLSFNSPQPFEPGTKIQIESELFATIGMDSPFLRVMHCRPAENQFLVRTQYIGLNESSLQPLRVWIRSRTLSKAS